MEFKQVKLESVTENLNSKRVPLASSIRNKMENKQYPYYGAQGVIDLVDDFLFDGKYLLVAEDGENLRSKKKDIAIIAEGKFWVNNHAHILKENDESNLYYLKEVINRTDISGYITGSAQPKLNKQNLNRIRLSLPSKKIQDKTGHLIQIIEEKEEINKGIIINLERLVQTLFKRWFIDFEFPNEDGKPYKSNGGRMKESEIGMIPKDFEVQLLSESTEFLSGGTPKTNVGEYWDGEIPFFTPKDITGSVYVTQTLKTITPLGLSKSNTKLYPKDTVFITARGTVGKLNIANMEMAMNQSCFALKQKQGFQFFLYFMLETLLRQIIQGSNGAVFNAINLKDLNILKIVKPTNKLIADFEDMVIPLLSLMSEKEKENIAFKEMRDTLLPKLLSGEIELPDETEVTAHVPIP